MLRAIAGIVVGYLIFAVPSFLVFRLTHVDPHVPASPAFEAIAVVYGIVFALLGGYLGTAVSGKQRLWIAFTIAAIMATGAIASMIVTGINWSPVTALVCMAPATIAGGWLRLRQGQRNDKGAKA